VSDLNAMFSFVITLQCKKSDFVSDTNATHRFVTDMDVISNFVMTWEWSAKSKSDGVCLASVGQSRKNERDHDNNNNILLNYTYSIGADQVLFRCRKMWSIVAFGDK
jgi:hypothetical protein